MPKAAKNIFILHVHDMLTVDMRKQTEYSIVGNGLSCNAQIKLLRTDFVNSLLHFGPAIMSGLPGTLPGRRSLHVLRGRSGQTKV